MLHRSHYWSHWVWWLWIKGKESPKYFMRMYLRIRRLWYVGDYTSAGANEYVLESDGFGLCMNTHFHWQPNVFLYIVTLTLPTQYDFLTYWGRDKMAAISQTTVSNLFSWMKMYTFRLEFHWSLFLRVQLTTCQRWLRERLGADQATSHYLNQWLWDYRLCFNGCPTVQNIYPSETKPDITEIEIEVALWAA